MLIKCFKVLRRASGPYRWVTWPQRRRRQRPDEHPTHHKTRNDEPIPIQVIDIPNSASARASPGLSPRGLGSAASKSKRFLVLGLALFGALNLAFLAWSSFPVHRHGIVLASEALRLPAAGGCPPSSSPAGGGQLWQPVGSRVSADTMTPQAPMPLGWQRTVAIARVLGAPAPELARSKAGAAGAGIRVPKIIHQGVRSRDQVYCSALPSIRRCGATTGCTAVACWTCVEGPTSWAGWGRRAPRGDMYSKGLA